MKLCPTRRSLLVLLLALVSGGLAYLAVQRRSPAPDAGWDRPPAPEPTTQPPLTEMGAPGPVVVDDVVEEPEAAEAPVEEVPAVEEPPPGKHLADTEGLEQVPAEEVGDDMGEGLPAGPFGPGSAEPQEDGSSPGAAYTIKGNTGSMLFHAPDSPYYERTKAEAWFATEDAARAAGFASWRDRAAT